MVTKQPWGTTSYSLPYTSTQSEEKRWRELFVTSITQTYSVYSVCLGSSGLRVHLSQWLETWSLVILQDPAVTSLKTDPQTSVMNLGPQTQGEKEFLLLTELNSRIIKLIVTFYCKHIIVTNRDCPITCFALDNNCRSSWSHIDWYQSFLCFVMASGIAVL